MIKTLYFDIKTKKDALLLFNTFKKCIINYDDCSWFLLNFDYDFVEDFYTPNKFSIVVENDGETLSPAQRERLFEPFSRFSAHGNGLGLWICYQIVTQLNGDIRAESNDRLTRFIINIPLDTHSDINDTPTLPD